MCQTGTCRRFKHATKDYLTILISETLQIWWTDMGYEELGLLEKFSFSLFLKLVMISTTDKHTISCGLFKKK
jgi:hypothetical protein